MTAANSNRSAFLEISHQLNANIDLLSAAIEGGTPTPGVVERARAEALLGIERLQGLQIDPGTLAANVARVVDHLDLFVAATDAVTEAPALARKLLVHLLEEQVEITAQEEEALQAEQTPAGPPAPAPTPGPSPDQELLGGGRKPLTVGSLIGR